MKLIELSSLAEGASLGIDTPNMSLVVIRYQNRITVYENRCPHLGVSLEFMPGQFLTHDKSLIQCSTHGALFEHMTGECISGPCQGQALRVIEHSEIDGWITL